MKEKTGFCIAVGGRILSQPDYSVEVCARTGLLRRNPALSDEDLDFYYATNEWWRHCYPRLFPTERLLHGALVDQLPADARVLDIGCGDGRLLEHMPDSYTKFGTELSEGAAEAARKRGVSIVKHEDALAGKHGLFDAITMVDVFEHLKQPHEFIESLMLVLKPGGLLGISTGDGDCRGVRQDPEGFWYWRVIAHVSMWTEAYARFAEKALGCQRTFVGRCSHYEFETKTWLKQLVQKMAYNVYHERRWAWLRPVFAMLPFVSRAGRWKERPPYWFGRDHVVTVLRKN